MALRGFQVLRRCLYCVLMGVARLEGRWGVEVVRRGSAVGGFHFAAATMASGQGMWVAAFATQGSRNSMQHAWLDST